MSGYTIAAGAIADAMHKAYQEGATLDEMFAVLSVQRELTSVHLAQAALHQQAVLAHQAQAQADKAAMEADMAREAQEADPDYLRSAGIAAMEADKDAN